MTLPLLGPAVAAAAVLVLALTLGAFAVPQVLGTPGYVPAAQGMQAALPYIDHFAAAGGASDYKARARTLRI